MTHSTHTSYPDPDLLCCARPAFGEPAGSARRQSELVSVVIPTRNRGLLIAQTLETLLATGLLPLEIIVADQSDPLQTAATRSAVEQAATTACLTASYEDDGDSGGPKLAKTTAGVLRYLRCRGRGAGNGRNAGAWAARGAVVLFVDDDTIADPELIAAVEHEFRQDRQVVGVYGRVLAPESRGGDGGKVSGIEVTRDGTRTVFRQPTLPWYLGSGGNMAFRRDALLACGGLDEVLGAGAPLCAFEDLDIGYRLLARSAGTVVFSDAATIYHDNPKDFAEQLRTERGYGIGAGAAFIKYLRCGDRRAPTMLATWFWHMAVRRSVAGLLKWRNPRVVQLALIQFYAPLLGVARALAWPVDADEWRYKVPNGQD